MTDYERMEIPILESAAHYDLWVKRFTWCMEVKLMEETNITKKNIKAIAALIQASRKVPVMEEIVLGAAQDIQKPPNIEDILKKLDTYFKPHMAQQRSMVRRKFYTMEHGKLKEKKNSQNSEEFSESST
eukprot:GHVR01170810.1.p1 GENE.GHVR01170810.1~~GHVR01170810.1.p1  ORF type:complete len:129 (-),score=17.00 GHVR01170810.1:128-514(-)